MPEELADIIKRAKETIAQMDRIATQANHLADKAKAYLEKVAPAPPTKAAGPSPPPGKGPPGSP
jgi:hypothetical protein